MEKEIINRKVPGFILSTFLFFFFYLLIRTVYQDIPLMYNDMLDAAIAEDESVLQSSLLAFFDIIMLSLSFWSIIRLLKGKPDCITCIRWALVINFLVLLYEFFCKSLGRAIAFHWTYAILPAASLLFTIVFFIYLAKSHSVKQLYPASEPFRHSYADDQLLSADILQADGCGSLFSLYVFHFFHSFSIRIMMRKWIAKQ